MASVLDQKMRTHHLNNLKGLDGVLFPAIKTLPAPHNKFAPASCVACALPPPPHYVKLNCVSYRLRLYCAPTTFDQKLLARFFIWHALEHQGSIPCAGRYNGSPGAATPRRGREPVRGNGPARRRPTSRSTTFYVAPAYPLRHGGAAGSLASALATRYCVDK